MAGSVSELEAAAIPTIKRIDDRASRSAPLLDGHKFQTTKLKDDAAGFCSRVVLAKTAGRKNLTSSLCAGHRVPGERSRPREKGDDRAERKRRRAGTDKEVVLVVPHLAVVVVDDAETRDEPAKEDGPRSPLTRTTYRFVHLF